MQAADLTDNIWHIGVSHKSFTIVWPYVHCAIFELYSSSVFNLVCEGTQSLGLQLNTLCQACVLPQLSQSHLWQESQPALISLLPVSHNTVLWSDTRQKPLKQAFISLSRSHPVSLAEAADVPFSWQLPYRLVSVSGWKLLLSSAPLLICEILRWSLFSFLADLDHFKVHTRSAVSVREGQGVVLLCGTPTSSGGKLSGLHLNLHYCFCFYVPVRCFDRITV